MHAVQRPQLPRGFFKYSDNLSILIIGEFKNLHNEVDILDQNSLQSALRVIHTPMVWSHSSNFQQIDIFLILVSSMIRYESLSYADSSVFDMGKALYGLEDPCYRGRRIQQHPDNT